MKIEVKAGATSVSIMVFIQDSSSSTGAGLTGLVYNTSSLVAYYTLMGASATATAISLATLAAINSAYSSGGFKEVHAINMPGWYRLDIPNAALASGRCVSIMLHGAANMAPCPIEIALVAWDNQDTVRGGLTALPNAAAEASGGLITRGTGTGQLSVSSGQVILQSGTGTGQLDFTSGVVKANVTQYGGSAGTFASGRPEVNTTHAAGTAWGSGAITSGSLSAGAKSAIATSIWQDTTVGDFSTANSIGKSLYTGVAPGAVDGLFIAGTNAAITVPSATVIGTLSIETILCTDFAISSELSFGSMTGDISGPIGNSGFGDASNTKIGELFKVLMAAVAGKSSGLTTTGASAPKYRDRADTKDVISAVSDQAGNRSTVTLDLT